MLNKIVYFKRDYQAGASAIISKASDDEKTYGLMKADIEGYYLRNNRKCIIERADGRGRCSYTFNCYDQTRGKTSFLKANVPGARHQAALKNEYTILSTLYPSLSVGLHEITEGCSMVEMDYLFPPKTAVDPCKAKRIIDECRRALSPIDGDMMDSYDMDELIRAARMELPVLCEGWPAGGCRDTVLSLFDYLEDAVRRSNRVLCHGDFSDANLMEDKDGRLVLIDWEDAFWGIGNYDFYYWMTFFGHRRYYSGGMFGKTEEAKYNLSIMCLVVVLKEAMSLYNGENKNNTMPADERIMELVKLWRTNGVE